MCGTAVDKNNTALMSQISDLGIGHRCHLLGQRSDVAKFTHRSISQHRLRSARRFRWPSEKQWRAVSRAWQPTWAIRP